MSEKNGKKPLSSPAASSPLSALGEMLGTNSLLDPEQLDAGLLWMTVVALLRRGAALHLGVNKARTSIILTIYDGDYPHKEFCDSIDRVHHVLAALVKVYMRGELTPEWQERVDLHFP